MPRRSRVESMPGRPISSPVARSRTSWSSERPACPGSSTGSIAPTRRCWPASSATRRRRRPTTRSARPLGRRPLEAADDVAVAHVFLAGWVLEGARGDGFAELWSELTAGEIEIAKKRLLGRRVEDLVTEDKAEARAVLLGIVAKAVS